MYWAVIGCWTVVEAVLGWVLVWYAQALPILQN